MSMSFKEAYDMAQSGSSRVYKGAQESQQKDIIGNILAEAQASNDPAVMQQTLGKILSQVAPERQAGALQYMKYVADQNAQQQQRQAVQEEGINPYLPKELQKEQFAQKNKIELEKMKAVSEKKELKLNEELNQQKSRTKARVDDIIRPYGMVDPFTRMITWNKNVGEEERAKINKRIEAERKRSFLTQKNLYKRYGQPVPDDLEETLEEDYTLEAEDSGRSEKVEEAVNLIKQLMSKQ